jgi:purine-binding chemotaxis protein CheW
MPITAASQMAVLLCRSGGRTCAIPLQHVGETMRALPIDPVPDLPACVAGAAMVRGAVTPVLDLGCLIGANPDTRTGAGRYFVSLRIGGRQAALAVDAVLGVASLGAGELEQTPPLLAAGAEAAVGAIAARDAALLLVLQASRLLPEGTS